MKKLLTAMIFLTITVLCFTSCGQVASVKKLKRMARLNGKCTYLRCEEGDDYRTAYFEDELGFEYYIKSYMSEIWIDGTSFGSTPSTSSDYKEKYLGCLCDMINAEHPYCTARLAPDSYDGVRIIADPAESPDNVNEIGKAFVEAEDRKVFIETVIKVYDNDDEDNYDEVGSYGVDQERYLDEVETKGAYYMDRVRDYAYTTGKNKALKPKYTRYEHLDYSAVPGLSSKSLATLAGDPDPQEVGVDVYYFTVKGEEYFITNALINSANGSDVFFYNTYIDDPYDKY